MMVNRFSNIIIMGFFMVLISEPFESVAQTRAFVIFGTNFSTIYSSIAGHYPTRLGFHGGVSIEYSLNNKLSLLQGIQFSEKGSNFDGNPPITNHFYINYMTFSQTINLKTTNWLYFKAGYEFGYISMKKYAFLNEDFTLGANNFEIGPLLGIRFQYRLMEIGINGYSGLTNLAKMRGFNRSSEIFKNRNLQFYAALIIE